MSLVKMESMSSFQCSIYKALKEKRSEIATKINNSTQDSIY